MKLLASYFPGKLGCLGEQCLCDFEKNSFSHFRKASCLLFFSFSFFFFNFSCFFYKWYFFW